MSKSINFKSLSNTKVDTINTVLDVQFAFQYERKELSKALKSLNTQLEDVTLIDSDIKAIKAKIGVINSKRVALSKWRNTQLLGVKGDTTLTSETGFYALLGIDESLYTAYTESVSKGTYGAYNNAIKSLLDGLGIHLNYTDKEGRKNSDKLVGKLASYLEHAIGLKVGNVLKGTELVRNESRTRFYDVFFNALAQYIRESNYNITIPNETSHIATISYNKDITTVEGYSVELQTDTVEDESTARDENTTEKVA